MAINYTVITGRDDHKNFWERLGIDEAGLPIHFPMGVNEQGQGPAEPDPPHRYACWCGQGDCPLNLTLQRAHVASLRSLGGAS